MEKDEAGEDPDETASPLRLISGRGTPPILIVDSPGLPRQLVGCTRRAVPIALPFMAITGVVLTRLRPPAVVFALFGIQVDATAVLARLDGLKYRGRVFALTPPLPDAQMVERELQAQFPDLRFRVIQMADLMQARADTR